MQKAMAEIGQQENARRRICPKVDICQHSGFLGLEHSSPPLENNCNASDGRDEQYVESRRHCGHLKHYSGLSRGGEEFSRPRKPECWQESTSGSADLTIVPLVMSRLSPPIEHASRKCIAMTKKRKNSEVHNEC